MGLDEIHQAVMKLDRIQDGISSAVEERVRSLGGTFRAGPGEGGGWTVFASVPRGREAEARGAQGDSGVTTCCGM